MALRKFINDGGALQIGDDGGLTEADITFTVKEGDGTTMLVGVAAERFGLPPLGTRLADARVPGTKMRSEEAGRRCILGSLQVEMAARSRDGGRLLRTWIQIIRPGVLGRLEANPSLFDMLARNFEAQDQAVPVFDSMQAAAEDGPAVGWVEQLENRDAAGLWAEVEWNDRALPSLQARYFAHASCALITKSRDPQTGADRGTVLVNVLLTNNASDLAGRL